MFAGLKDVELDPSGSISGFPIPLDLYDHLSSAKVPIAVAFFALAGLQLFRAIVCCVIKERLQRCVLLGSARARANAGGRATPPLLLILRMAGRGRWTRGITRVTSTISLRRMPPPPTTSTGICPREPMANPSSHTTVDSSPGTLFLTALRS